MDGCAKAFSKRECEATEVARLKMSREQPATQYNYTEIGFKKLKTPENVFKLIQEFWEANKGSKQVERWGRAYTYTNNWEIPTHMVSVEDGKLRGAGALLKSKIWNGIKPIIEEWTGHSLQPTSLYGIREYGTGAILSTHVDRLPLVSSCIINVAQDLNEPWPLEVYDHAGRAHNVTMEPGDLVLYEVIHLLLFPCHLE
jgi:prolyl 4-hydroxylase